jgi:hypothetical protein
LEAEREKQSKAVKQGLPRPVAPQTMLFPTSLGASERQKQGEGAMASLQQAESLLHEEMAALITHDAFVFPIAKPPKKPPGEIEDFSRADLDRANELFTAQLAEFDGLSAENREFVSGGALQEAIEEGIGNLAYLPQAKRYVEWRSVSKADRLEAAKHSFEVAEAQAQKDEKRSKKLEEKLQKVLGGYMSKAKQSLAKLAALAEERETVGVETEVFRTLRAREEKAIESRVEELREAVEREKQRNHRLQTRYKELKLLEKVIDEKLQ